jgi:hypothetical protein
VRGELSGAPDIRDPDTTSPYLLATRKTAHTGQPVSEFWLIAPFRGLPVTAEQLRDDRIAGEALAGRAVTRRLETARQATAGAVAAAKRYEHLLQMTRQRAERAEVIRLRYLMAHAAGVLADLAKTEQGIAGMMTGLAARDGSDLAAQRRQAAGEAAPGARRARVRAQALHQLAKTAAARPRPKTGRV